MIGRDPGVPWALAADFFVNAGLALLVGAIASLVWSRRYRSPWSSELRSQSSNCAGIGAAVALSANVVDLWSRSATAADVPLMQAWPAVHSMLIGSHYGRAWAVGTIALMTVIPTAGFGLARQDRRRSFMLAVTTVCVAIFVHARSVVSHASADGDLSVAVAVDWSHLVLIALWVGMVFVASIVDFRQLGQAVHDRRDAAAWIRSLSRTATVALVGIVATGAFNTWRATGGSLGKLAGSEYGTILFIKLLLVAVSIGLGAHNRFRRLPALLAELEGEGTDVGRLRSFVAVVRVEALTLAAALATAAVLSSAEPPIA